MQVTSGFLPNLFSAATFLINSRVDKKQLIIRSLMFTFNQAAAKIALSFSQDRKAHTPLLFDSLPHEDSCLQSRQGWTCFFQTVHREHLQSKHCLRLLSSAAICLWKQESPESSPDLLVRLSEVPLEHLINTDKKITVLNIKLSFICKLYYKIVCT